MGIRSIAVYHFSDRRSPHVQLADVALELEAETPTAAYLDIPQIVAAAKSCSAAALHPGYGFLAENAEFARAVTDQGLIFIGPSPDVIEVMGDKIRATDFAAAAGIPVPPRAMNDDIPILLEEIDAIGYPVLIKAAAGGGGKGMKIVNNRKQLRDQLNAAQSEAERYFLDGRVYIEKLIDQPRHIEVQIL
ncbi:MAG TPA: biotin carboxylase, partial [Gammaproteobacteria bacterium]|nr:biotin carboxylase [Gammaproteobacteria bacterium]